MNSNNYFEAALSDQSPYSDILQGTMRVFNALPLQQGLTVTNMQRSFLSGPLHADTFSRFSLNT